MVPDAGASLVHLGRLASEFEFESESKKSSLVRCEPVQLDTNKEEDATTLKHLNPWKRRRPKEEETGLFKLFHKFTYHDDPQEAFQSDVDMDIHSKTAILKVSPSVVGVISYQGGNQVFWGSGVIFDCFWENDAFVCYILTSATSLTPPPPHTCFDDGLLCYYHACNGDRSSDSDEAHLTIDGKIDVCLKGGRICAGAVVTSDPHYNFAVLRFKSDIPLPCAVLRAFDDVPTSAHDFYYPPLKLIPGDGVIAVGRYFTEPFQIMAAPGKYSGHSFGKDNKLDCMELFRADCKITKCGIGGPLISCRGEVIGMNFYDGYGTPFLPINIFLRWWSHYRVTGSYCRPSLGMQVANLDTAKPEILELGISEGLVVVKVLSGSPAETFGVRPGDVIIECSATRVFSSLQLFEIIWDLAEKAVEVVLLSDGSYKNLTIEVKDVTSKDELYQWLLPRCTVG